MPATLERTRSPGPPEGSVALLPATVADVPRTAPDLPPAQPDLAPPRSGATSSRYELLSRAAGYTWVAAMLYSFFVAASFAEDVPRPLWLELAGWTVLLGIFAGAMVLSTRPRAGWLVFAALGAVGVAAGIGCRAAHHHAAHWWISETALFAAAALCSLAAARVAPRRRPSR
jgi:hypothetical protein